MKDLQLTDRIVVEFTTHDDNIPNNEFIAYNLRRIGSSIEGCCCGGSDKVEDMQNGGEYHILWWHESVSYGGFRMGDKSLIGMHYYGSEPKPRIIKDDEFVVCYLTKSDIEQQHFVPSGIDDDTMESIASRMNEYLCEGVGYWDALDAACEFYDIPRKEDEP